MYVRKQDAVTNTDTDTDADTDTDTDADTDTDTATNAVTYTDTGGNAVVHRILTQRKNGGTCKTIQLHMLKAWLAA